MPELLDVSVTDRGVQVVFSIPFTPVYGQVPLNCKWGCDLVRQAQSLNVPETKGLTLTRIDVVGYEAQASWVRRGEEER